VVSVLGQRQRSQRAIATVTYRQRVLAFIESSDGQLTGLEIAQATGLTYRQTIDALNALNNAAKIARIGRKSKARWTRLAAIEPAAEPMAMVEAIFYSIIRGSRD